MARLKVPVTQHDHIRGPADAAVTLIEYGDYECAQCLAAHAIVKAVQDHFPKDLRFVFRHFPLKTVHPNAEAAAEGAEFAGARDRFWEMHDGLYGNQERLGLPLLLELAEALGLPGAELRKALETGEYAPRVRSDFQGGVRSGVNGTPTFFIDGRRHDGSFAFDELVAAIELQLHPRPTRWPSWRVWRTH